MEYNVESFWKNIGGKGLGVQFLNMRSLKVLLLVSKFQTHLTRWMVNGNRLQSFLTYFLIVAQYGRVNAELGLTTKKALLVVYRFRIHRTKPEAKKFRTKEKVTKKLYLIFPDKVCLLI